MNFLISNDDGIDARGIRELTKALSTIGTCYVFAPAEQQSAMSHAISMRRPLDVKEYTDVEGAKEAYSVTGTPADCVRLGDFILREKGIQVDMVVGGINHGGNLGTDTIYSGTISVAMEGNIIGYPAVAVSVCSHEASHFDYACDLALGIIKASLGQLGPDTTVSINVPDLPGDEIKGVKVLKLGPRNYQDKYVLTDTQNGVKTYKFESDIPDPSAELPENLDVVGAHMGYATVTPLLHDYTDCGLMEAAEAWTRDALKHCK